MALKMKLFKTLSDAARVGQDVLAIGGYFTDVPFAMVTLGKDVALAVYNRDTESLKKIKTDAVAIFDLLGTDRANAQPAIDQFNNDLDTLIADFS